MEFTRQVIEHLQVVSEVSILLEPDIFFPV